MKWTYDIKKKIGFCRQTDGRTYRQTGGQRDRQADRQIEEANQEVILFSDTNDDMLVDEEILLGNYCSNYWSRTPPPPPPHTHTHTKGYSVLSFLRLHSSAQPDPLVLLTHNQDI